MAYLLKGERTILTKSSGHTTFSTSIGAHNNVTGNSTKWPADTTEASTRTTTERFDRGNNLSGLLFTAPVTGIYLFTISINIAGLTTNETYGNGGITTSDQHYIQWHTYDWFEWAAPGASWIFVIRGSVIADMDAGDVAWPNFTVTGGSDVVDVGYGFFTGCLLA